MGVRHATDADHVVAISTIVTQQKKLKNASIIGALWGIGHTITVFIVGVAIIIFHVVIPPRVGLFLEFAVAIALIILGIRNLLISPDRPHTHIHFHDLNPHIHIHEHTALVQEEMGVKVSIRRFVRQFGLFQLLRPIIIGLIHGLAGSAAIALLIVGSIKSPQVAVFYLLIFGLGTMIGMMVITTLIGMPIIFAAHRFTKINRYITILSGILSLVFGLYLAYEIGITQQLFSLSPQWDPH